MSKKEILFLLSLLCFCNCSNPLSDDIEQTPDTFPVKFTVQLNKEISPFVNVRSFPNDSIPEPQINGDTISLPNSGDIQYVCTCIDYIVYKTENTQTPFKSRRYISDNLDIDFGIVYDTLPAGNYEIRFLAHSSITNEQSENILTFDKVTDAFYKQISLTIGSGENSISDINLQRIVGRVEFMATDTIHSNLKQFEIHITNYPNRFNILTGKGIPSSETSIITHPFTSNDIGKSNNSHTLLTFIPEVGQNLSIELLSLDYSNKPIRNYTITSVTPQVNKTVRYSGKLYSPTFNNNTLNLFLENINWGESINIPLDN